MLPSAELLWRANNEYVVRLARACNTLDLLLPLIERHYATDDPLRDILGNLRAHLTHMQQEHRQWRYRYFYESPDEKRMVQGEAEVLRAFSRFSLVRSRHDNTLLEYWARMEAVPRPSPTITRVTGGDLWERVRLALGDLIEFDRFLEELAQ